MTKSKTLSRRSFLAGTAGALAMPMISSRTMAQSNTVVAASTGGSYEASFVKNIFEPFTAETGINVQLVPLTTLDRIKAMQLTRNVTLDIHLGSNDLFASSGQNFWEPFDPSNFDANDLSIPPGADYLVYELTPVGVCWNPERYRDGQHPTNFSEFFDLNAFPGRRSLRSNPNTGALEIALLGAGVAPKDIYPLDLDRAFTSLERIKSMITWSPVTPQDVALVQSGESDFGIAGAGRVKATTQSGGGVPLEMSFAQNFIVTSGAAIPRGAPNKDNAVKLLSFMARPEIQAAFTGQLGITPVSRRALSMLPEENQKWTPDFDSPLNLMPNPQYWAENYHNVNRRFQEWKLSN